MKSEKQRGLVQTISLPRPWQLCAICVWCWRTSRRTSRWAVSCRLQAPLPPQLQYGQTGSYQTVSNMFTLLYGHCVFALLHVLIVEKKKKVFSQSMFWSCSWLSCDRRDLFVAGWGFSGFSCPAGVRAVVLLRGVSCLVALHTLHQGCFASFLTDWLSSVEAYCETMIFYVEPFLLLWIIILFFIFIWRLWH